MRKRLTLVTILIGVLVLLAACGKQATPAPTRKVAQPTEASAPTKPPPTEAPKVELVGDPIRGGVLYDKWWPVLGMDAPKEDHPLWATQTTNKRSGSATWRCKECHGWDYKGKDGAYGEGSSHYTGFPGVLDAAKKGAEYVLGALKGETNPDHDFSTVMDEQALIDLALFIAEETTDYDQFIGEGKKAKGGDLTLGEDLFQENCSECHGPQGTAINFKDEAGPEYIASIALDNPWEFSHKMRFGQPTEPNMPSAVDMGWTPDEQLAVLAYAQSLPTSSPVTEGGVLYDKWWKAVGVDAPEGDQPLWALQTTNKRSGADTWRCKECHGWDYKGKDGAYGEGSSHYTGFPGILDAASKSAEELAGWLNGTANPDHDFSAYLSEEQIAMLVAFMKEGMVDMAKYINADKTVNGDPAKGKTLFNRGCKRCHGEDGKTINFKDEAHPEYIGTIANENPWEFFHKASFGQPGEHMPAGLNFGWTPQDIADLLSYAQTLPEE